jgi:hypothetical protein
MILEKLGVSHIAAQRIAGADIGERWSSRLVATPSADCLSKATGGKSLMIKARRRSSRTSQPPGVSAHASLHLVVKRQIDHA